MGTNSEERKNIVWSHDKDIKELEDFWANQKLLYEGLIHSYNTNVITRGLKGRGYKDENIGVERNSNGNVYVIKFFLDENSKKRLESLNKFMSDLCGWGLGTIKDEDGIKIENEDFFKPEYEQKFVWLQYEPKFNERINAEDFPKKMYHITTTQGFKKIKEIGLTPKTRTGFFFAFKNRIYLTDTAERLIQLAQRFVTDKYKKQSNIKDNKVITDFIVLEINIYDIKLPIKLFKDPNFINGFYTLDNIRRGVIKPIMEIDFNVNGEVVNFKKL